MSVLLTGCGLWKWAACWRAHSAASFSGDFGAEVIKVEAPGKGDPMREWGRHRKEGRTLWWPIIARNKKSVTLNLRERRRTRPGPQTHIAEADVLVENFRPGTMECWGMGYGELAETNPGLVMVRVSGFGQTGTVPQTSRFRFHRRGDGRHPARHGFRGSAAPANWNKPRRFTGGHVWGARGADRPVPSRSPRRPGAGR